MVTYRKLRKYSDKARKFNEWISNKLSRQQIAANEYLRAYIFVVLIDVLKEIIRKTYPNKLLYFY